MRALVADYERVVGAATLAAAAFRLRDQEGLVLALRALTTSLSHLTVPPDPPGT